MQSFIISSDSTCDLYADFIREHDLRIVSLHYTMEKNGVLAEGEDSFTEYSQYVDFYRQQREGALSRTSMLNFESHYRHFAKIAEEGAKEILHFSLSSGLSPTANVAKDAARAVEEKYPSCTIRTVDSLAATIGQGALVREALRLRSEGKTLDEAYEYTLDMRLHYHYVIGANDLYYLQRGGRVSKMAAVAGSVLNVKPILTFTTDGKLSVVEKVRGMKRVFAYALEKMERINPVEENRLIHIVHTDAEKEANELDDLIEKRWNFRPYVTIMGPVIGSHMGPGSVSVIWKAQQVRQD